MAVWGNDWSRADAPAGVREAAEQLAAARLESFDTHRWRVYRLPAQWWICQACLLPIEATCGRPCPGGSPIER